MILKAFRLYFFIFSFIAVTLVFIAGGFYLQLSLDEALDERNSELASERMENMTNELTSNFSLVTKQIDKLKRYIEKNPNSTDEDIIAFVEINLLPKDLSAFFNSQNNDFINGYIIAPNDNVYTVYGEHDKNFSKLSFYDNTSEYYIDLTKRNPVDVVVQGPIISPRTHEINVFNRKAIYVDGKYWGYIGAIVDFYKLLESMKLNAEDDLYVYSIKASIHKSNSDFIWGDSSLFRHSNMVYRQKSVFFGKQRWDFALKLKNIGKVSYLKTKLYTVFAILCLVSYVFVFYLVKYYIELRRVRNIDPVTSTMVHERFLNYVSKHINDKADHGVLVLEIVHFNQINSCYDYKVGDAILLEVTKRIRSVISYNDVISRMGTEYFIFMQNIMSNIDVERVQSELFDAMNKPFNVLNVTVNIKVAIASSSTISKGRNFLEIMNSINASLLEFKKNMKFFSRETDVGSK